MKPVAGQFAVTFANPPPGGSVIAPSFVCGPCGPGLRAGLGRCGCGPQAGSGQLAEAAGCFSRAGELRRALASLAEDWAHPHSWRHLMEAEGQAPPPGAGICASGDGRGHAGVGRVSAGVRCVLPRVLRVLAPRLLRVWVGQCARPRQTAQPSAFCARDALLLKDWKVLQKRTEVLFSFSFYIVLGYLC